MNQVKIWAFIAECRKKQNLTQLQLAEKLYITDKAVSKWERGIAMPDSSLMLDLCEILKISVDELLNGEKISMEEKNQKNEEILLNITKELEHKNKTIWTSMCIILVFSIIALIGFLLSAAIFMEEGTPQLIVIIVCCVVFLIPCFYALKLEISVGSYKCKKCGTEIIPTYKKALFALSFFFPQSEIICFFRSSDMLKP